MLGPRRIGERIYYFDEHWQVRWSIDKVDL
jgi:hypothetical protein